MSTPAPVLADADHLLREHLYEHLHEAEYLAERDNEWSEDDAETARELIGDLALVLRRLLSDHRLQGGADCRTCTSAWPCPVVRTIHATVKDPHRQFVALTRRAKGEREQHT